MNRAERRATGHRREREPRLCDALGVIAANVDGEVVFSIGLGDQGEVPVASLACNGDELEQLAGLLIAFARHGKPGEVAVSELAEHF